MFLEDILPFDIKPTVFVTHPSAVIECSFQSGLIERGLHPNFLPGSSQGDNFQSVIETCLKFAPEAECFRAHRGFDVTDTTHLMVKYGMKYDSNLVSLMTDRLRPILMESGLIRFPIYYEDGTHLFNRLALDLERLKPHFLTSGLKIISIHPMNWVVNPPTLQYMRSIKDSLTRTAYNQMDRATIELIRHRGYGIADFSRQLIEFITQFRVYKLSELYQIAIS